ncbi:Hint domain-containing protein [Acidisoma cellulosilytica]|uniref:Hint domain-containing protein n=1 Tax=Acidisoma cellulosilyticum TaxID=2802395 RepID=A0A964E2K9_9PROT|nr:Hint domain-containing protein [Acidisoma cellulosilyticum]MCB8879735.1 Hint domain-containing protein [Acidisoma cellulosilyticum]
MSDIIVSSGQVVSGLTIGSTTSLDIMAGGSAVDLTVSGGTVTVDGGSASDITIIGGGTVFSEVSVTAGGSVVNTVVDYGGDLFLSGGFATSTTVSGGVLTLAAGGVARDTSVTDAALSSNGVAAGDLYILSGGTAVVTTVSAPAGPVGLLAEVILSSGGSAVSTTVFSGGALSVSSGGFISDTVLSGGNFFIQPTSIASGQILTDQVVSAFTYYEIEAGASATSLTIQGGGRVDVVNGAVVQDIALSGNGATPAYLGLYFGGLATSTTVKENATLRLVDGIASHTVVEDSIGQTAGEFVYSGGSTIDTSILSGGYLAVSSGGSAADLLVSGGDAVLTDGAVLDGVHLAEGDLTLGAGAVTTGDITLDGGATLIISGSEMPAAIVDNFQPSDEIDLATIAFSHGASARFDSGTGLLTVTEGGEHYELKLAGNYAHATFALRSDDGGSGSLLTVSLSCFAAGTRILAEQGLVAVEALRPEDKLRTPDGKLEPIVWIGSRHVDCRRHPRPSDILPVRIAAHAFGPGRPARDLFLSPDHAIYAEDVLIPVKYLINGSSIAQVDRDHIDYFHVELPQHGIILAEGLAVESYLDSGDRANFCEGASAVALHPVFGFGHHDSMLMLDALGYAPLRMIGPEVDRVRMRLLSGSGPERLASA